ncbi:MAG: hypothetical protein D6704_01525 [Nitrospirae bacterium]|nr:MAG: hypothetical protein D6704_01525 [Nitrospirota bacterium]
MVKASSQLAIFEMIAHEATRKAQKKKRRNRIALKSRALRLRLQLTGLETCPLGDTLALN